MSLPDWVQQSWSRSGVRVVALSVVGIASFVGLICVFYYAGGGAEAEITTGNLRAFGALLVAGAAFFVGVSIGFLFGVPKTLQAGAAEESESVRHRPNTSLEEISDWLTKILVGIGLAELRNVPALIEGFGKYQAPLFGGGEIAQRVAGATGTFFAVCGFLVGYLGTRFFLQRAMRDADLGLVQRAEEMTADTIEALMGGYLYEDGGYRSALKLGEKNERWMSDRPWFWVYLAAAYGQAAQAASLSQQDGWQEAVENDRKKALKAARRAVELEPESTRAVILEMYQGTDPKNNDLEIFKPDKDFARLLGIPGMAVS